MGVLQLYRSNLGTIPNSVTEIGGWAFNSCSGLTEIYSYPAVAPVLGEEAFGEVTNTIPVYVPAGSVDSYSDSEGWDYFFNVRAMNEAGINIEAISEEADNDAEYFTLQGIRIEANKLAPGVYIRRVGTSTDKILVQ